ncbi:MAG: glycosyltransferase [Candidatus Bathyarchaeota archaeon]|nr:glycosyltransferase [Candidatus Bathyarchaeota archaeon]MDW8040701.1 glycosyltransferase [Nitrososphaerota archaeon]
MTKETLLFVSTKGETSSASNVRMRYFKQALEANGYALINFEIDLKGVKKYLSYFFRTPPKSLIKASEKADLVITTSPTLLNAILSCKVAKEHGLPLIIDVRDVWEEYAKTAHPLMHSVGVVKKLVAEYYEALNYASKIMVVTQPMKEYYENVLGAMDRIVVISNGTDVDVIKCEDKNVRREKDLVYLADLNHPYHNLEFLLKALKDGNLHLTVIGGGKYLAAMQKEAQNLQVNDRVSFVGWVPYENLTPHLCGAKVGVVGRPFVSNVGYLYAIPVKTYDYLAAGLPVAGYGPKNSALEDFIKRNEIGTYVDQPDPPILLSELAKLVEAHAKYVDKARELATKYDRKRLAQKLVETVKEVLAKNP